MLKVFFIDFLYEFQYGILSATTTSYTPVGDSHESENVDRNLFASIAATLKICLGIWEDGQAA